MELRSCVHLHFIQALKDGLVVKTLNVCRVRPVLKFKALEDIYEAEDEKNQNPVDEFEGFLYGSNRIQFERPIASDSDVSDLSCSEDENGRNSDTDDDLCTGKITLKEIREKCKAKKRKRSKFVDTGAGEFYIEVKEEIDEDESYLTKPLIAWKTKTSKKVKAKDRCLKNHVSTAPQSALSIAKAEQISSEKDFLVSSETLPVVVKVKVEAMEPDSLDHQNTINDSALLCDDQVVSWTDSQESRAVAKMATECDLEIKAPESDGGNKFCFKNKVDYCGEVPTEAPAMGTESASSLIYDRADYCEELPSEMPIIATEPESSLIYDDQVNFCGEVINQVPATDTECRDSLIYEEQADSCEVVRSRATTVGTECDLETEALIALTKGSQCSVISETNHKSSADSERCKVVNRVVDSFGTVPREVTEIATECFPVTEMLASGIEILQRCVVNEICYDHVEHAYSETEQSVYVAGVDIKEFDNIEANDDQDSESTGSKSACEGYVDQTPCASISSETVLPDGECTADLLDGFPCSSTKHAIPCNIDSPSKVQSTDVSTHEAHQQIGSNLGGDLCAMNDSAKDNMLSSHDTNCIYSSYGGYNLAPNGCLIPSPEDSPTSAAKQSQCSSYAVSENCLPQMPNRDTCEELSSSGGGSDHCSKLDPPPQRLLSTRKVISPDSQEKLCNAMESVEICQEEHYRPHKKLCFERQNGNESKANKTERTGRITKIKFSVSQKQNTVKPKREKRNTQAGVVSNGIPRFTTGCNSIESCTQSAIAFSQRQMQDIECLVTKLANELKTMKDIAEDRLYYEASPSISMKYKPNEVRMAIKSATKAEQLTNKWLSMMTRDCDRFCKIMTLAEKDSDASETENVVNKDRKKITFADEAGEELCHVKFFEKNLSESLQADTEKSNQLL